MRRSQITTGLNLSKEELKRTPAIVLKNYLENYRKMTESDKAKAAHSLIKLYNRDKTSEA
jgi:hypothetical protein